MKRTIPVIGGPLDGTRMAYADLGDAFEYVAEGTKTRHLYRLAETCYRYVGVIEKAD